MSENPEQPAQPVEPEKPKGRQTDQTRGQQVKTLKNLLAILSNPTLEQAYKSTHPNCTDKSAREAAGRMITPELIEELRAALAIDPKIKTTRVTLERFLYLILGKYIKGEERTSDALRAVELLSKLVPDFKDRIGVEDLSSLPESELDARLRRLGVNPDDAGN